MREIIFYYNKFIKLFVAERVPRDKVYGARRNSLSDGRGMSGDSDPGDLAEISKLQCRRGRPSRPQLTVSLLPKRKFYY